MDTANSLSVIIPAFNSAPTIRRALDSVLSQSLKPKQVIVVDDASTDDTASIVRSYADRGIELISLSRQRGAGGARNAGVNAATGDLIAFLDSDDEWLSSKLEMQIKGFVSPRISFVACAANLISPSGLDLGDIYKGHPVVTGTDSWKALLAFNFIATPTVVASREKILAVGGFDEKLKIGEDQDLWIKLALAGELAYVNESLVRVHSRENSLSAWSLDDVLTFTIPMIEGHVAALHNRLSHKEVRRIMGERLCRLGRVAYSKGVGTGFELIVRSIALGYRPMESILFLAVAAPQVTWLRRRLGIGSAS